MKHIITAILLCICVSAPAFADDNIANCEVVVQMPIDPDAAGETGEADGTAQIATFLPAGDFIFSVFGSKPHMAEIDGKPIRAVMCTRSSVVPSEFDLKMIRTGIPLYLSSDFDSTDSAFLSINKTEDGYTYSYAGPDLSVDDLDLLELRMKALNDAED